MATPDVERFAAPLADLASVAPSVQLVVLFGSVARGRARRDSDLDIAVRADELADLDALYVLIAPRLATSSVDLVDLRRAGPVLAIQIARHGRLLYERDPGAFRTFQSLASRRYADTDKLRRAQRRAITHSWSVGDSSEPGRRGDRPPEARSHRRDAGCLVPHLERRVTGR